MIGTSFHQEILKRLSDLGEVYIVGGAVRDAQLGIPGKDVDAVADLTLQEIYNKLSAWGYSPHLIGDKEQSVSIFQGTERLDIVSLAGDLATDALRRDFTINAVYCNVRTGKIKDPLHGLDDLRDLRLKACGCAEDRFQDDPLRILRLVRLAVRYNLETDYETWQVAIKLLPCLNGVSAERVTEELGRILILKDVDKALGLLDNLGYFQTYIPELAKLKGLVQNRYHSKDAWGHTRQVVSNTPPNLLLRLAALFHDLGKWETASRECYVRGIILPRDYGFKVNEFKVEGKNLEPWINKLVEVHGGRLDNYPETIVVKSIKAIEITPETGFEMVPDGKRHFLQHEKESVRLVKEILTRFRWSIVLPGGKKGEQEILFLVGHHMSGTMTFRKVLQEGEEENKVRNKARRFAWDMGWNGQIFATQRVENLLDLWRADFLGGKQEAEKIAEQFDRIQNAIRKECFDLMERAKRLDWSFFHKFACTKGLEGETYGRFKEHIRGRVMTNVNNNLTDIKFLEREFGLFYTKKRNRTSQMRF